jgi:Dopa 4,5-dioxygenase family protein
MRSNMEASDVHIYYYQNNESQAKYAKELWERIRRECMRSCVRPTHDPNPR